MSNSNWVSTHLSLRPSFSNGSHTVSKRRSNIYTVLFMIKHSRGHWRSSLWLFVHYITQFNKERHMFCFPRSRLIVWPHMKEALSRMSGSRCWETQMFPVLRITGEPTLAQNTANVTQLWFSIQGLSGWRRSAVAVLSHSEQWGIMMCFI